MADIDRFLEVAATLPKGGMKPWWEKIGLSAEQSAQLAAAAAHPDITGRAIQIVLREWGHDIKLSSIAHYRRGIRG